MKYFPTEIKSKSYTANLQQNNWWNDLPLGRRLKYVLHPFVKAGRDLWPNLMIDSSFKWHDERSALAAADVNETCIWLDARSFQRIEFHFLRLYAEAQYKNDWTWNELEMTCWISARTFVNITTQLLSSHSSYLQREHKSGTRLFEWVKQVRTNILLANYSRVWNCYLGVVIYSFIFFPTSPIVIPDPTPILFLAFSNLSVYYCPFCVKNKLILNGVFLIILLFQHQLRTEV